MKKLLLLFGVIFLLSTVKGQPLSTADYPELVVKYCPEALASFNSPAVQFGLEYRFRPNSAWHNELGYVFNLNGASYYLHQLNGIRLLSEYRFYMSQSRSSLYNNFYLGISARYIFWSADRTGTFWRDRYAYQQKINYNLKQHRVSLNLCMGKEVQLSESVTLGFGLLLGRGFQSQKSTGIPANSEYIRPDFQVLRILQPGDPAGFVDFLIRFHLGYILK